jgi:hypothetical protein
MRQAPLQLQHRQVHRQGTAQRAQGLGQAAMILVIAAAANLSMNENRPVTIAEMEERLAKA